MNLKKIALATAAGTALLAAAPVFAQPPGWAPAYGWRAPYRHPHYRPAYVYAPPVYYVQPAPVIYAPPVPVYYAPPQPRVVVPAPVLYGSFPIGHNGRVSIGLGL